ncbi:hypothetical protein BASA83_013782 [Batrachochytrium salamandrivorans]|nr:hypothetical protein BASA83_013782 [Batrachochytrium salamandrivorans]
MADLDLHVLVHSTVLDKVFVQEADWPLIIADFLAGEDNVWIEEISEDWLELCKKELKNFRFRDNTFVRILNDGKSTATYMPSNDRVQVMKHYHESLAHLKYGSIIDLITRRFWWPDMKKDLKDYISRCPECQLNRSASRTHAPLPIRPVPPVALPSNAGESISMDQWWRQRVAVIEFERENSIRHLATTPYHPQTNGMVERMHLCSDWANNFGSRQRDRWDEYLPKSFWLFGLGLTLLLDFLAILFIIWNTPSTPHDETPPRSSLMPLDEIERMEENSEFIARNLEEVGQARSAANVRTKAQAEAMRKRNNFDENTSIITSRTYWIMTPQGLRLPNAVNQVDLAPWLAPVIDNVDFFYDGTNRNSSLDS